MSQCNFNGVAYDSSCDATFVNSNVVIEFDPVSQSKCEPERPPGNQLYVVMPGGKRVDLRTAEGQQALKDLAKKHRK